MDAHSNVAVIKVEERLPPPNKWVIAITDSYRTMGYIDDKGTWKDVNRHAVIEGVKAWCPTVEPPSKGND
jgi:hypothetical protein